MLGSTKLNNHIIVTVLKMVSECIPRRLNKYMATPPFITTSKMNIEGITEANKYIVEITINVCK